jgi:hypothetical protein
MIIPIYYLPLASSHSALANDSVHHQAISLCAFALTYLKKIVIATKKMLPPLKKNVYLFTNAQYISVQTGHHQVILDETPKW